MKCKGCGKEFNPQNSPYADYGPKCGQIHQGRHKFQEDIICPEGMVGADFNIPGLLRQNTILEQKLTREQMVELDSLLANKNEREILDSASKEEQTVISKNLETISLTRDIPATHPATAQDRLDLVEFAKAVDGEIKEIDNVDIIGERFSIVVLSSSSTLLYHCKQRKSAMIYEILGELKGHSTGTLTGDDTEAFWLQVIKGVSPETKKQMYKNYFEKTVGKEKLQKMSKKALENLVEGTRGQDLAGMMLKQWDKRKDYGTLTKNLAKQYPELTPEFLGKTLYKTYELLAQYEKPQVGWDGEESYTYKPLVADSSSPATIGNKKTNWRYLWT